MFVSNNAESHWVSSFFNDGRDLDAALVPHTASVPWSRNHVKPMPCCFQPMLHGPHLQERSVSEVSGTPVSEPHSPDLENEEEPDEPEPVPTAPYLCIVLLLSDGLSCWR